MAHSHRRADFIFVSDALSVATLNAHELSMAPSKVIKCQICSANPFKYKCSSCQVV